MGEIKIMNLKQYADVFPKEEVTSPTGSRDAAGVTRQAILYRVTNNLPLPNVVKVELIGRQYILHVKID